MEALKENTMTHEKAVEYAKDAAKRYVVPYCAIQVRNGQWMCERLCFVYSLKGKELYGRPKRIEPYLPYYYLRMAENGYIPVFQSMVWLMRGKYKPYLSISFHLSLFFIIFFFFNTELKLRYLPPCGHIPEKQIYRTSQVSLDPSQPRSPPVPILIDGAEHLRDNIQLKNAGESAMFRIEITEITEVEGTRQTYEKIADTGNETDGGPRYGYVIVPGLKEVESEILKTRVEQLDLKAVLCAILDIR